MKWPKTVVEKENIFAKTDKMHFFLNFFAKIFGGIKKTS